MKSRWVFRIKKVENGRLVKYKACLVAKGFTQEYGLDYDEGFAPVTRFATLRTPLATASMRNMEICSSM